MYKKYKNRIHWAGYFLAHHEGMGKPCEVTISVILQQVVYIFLSMEFSFPVGFLKQSFSGTCLSTGHSLLMNLSCKKVALDCSLFLSKITLQVQIPSRPRFSKMALSQSNYLLGPRAGQRSRAVAHTSYSVTQPNLRSFFKKDSDSLYHLAVSQ